MTQRHTPPATDDASRTPEPATHRPQSTAEWISLGFSSLILSLVVGLVIHLWVSDRQQQPPILEILQAAEIRSVKTRAATQYYVPFVVVNHGGETAEAVQVIAELQRDGILLESGEQTIDFLSRQEKAEGAFIFSSDPQLATLKLRVASYRKP
ncbi:TIGR02588 family protein [Lyngbya confervoides]|uniref:TIGR02588 family protein n=1 Tax=Lyngbya confervoides BDU141951 TaxID=1574623 RepID=A0ABD4T7N8_9CYAN|nr:TIGR02588 family protein [Lyngbya confervoides]MCM1984631.1 TIGR02588 family protein [Lyngbya confervoides BDU141951]